MVTTRARHSANMIMAHNDGDEHNTGNCDGSIKKNDGVHNDGNEGSVGNDVDEVNNGDIDNDGKNRIICTSDNHRGPCGWKIAHGCIFEDHEVPIQCQPSQCKGNLNDSCIRTVHRGCMWLWEHSSSAITPVDALLQFNLVCPMHHPHYKKPYLSAVAMKKCCDEAPPVMAQLL